MSKIDLYTIGNFTIDDIVLWDGRVWMGQTGGNALYSAIGARVWLERVGLLARVGRGYPEQNLRRLEEHGISLSLHEVDEPNMALWVLYEADGHRVYVVHPGAGDHIRLSLDAQDIPTEHLGGQAYHIAPMPASRQVELVERLKEADRLISLDPPDCWGTSDGTPLESVVAKVNFFLPSEVEAMHYFGRNDPEAAARAFSELGPQAVVIKLGSDGSLVYDKLADRMAHIPIYPAEVVDTTGAGDAFCGGFLAGYLLTRDPIAAARYGTVSASFIIESVGALAASKTSFNEARDRLTALAKQAASGTLQY